MNQALKNKANLAVVGTGVVVQRLQLLGQGSQVFADAVAPALQPVLLFVVADDNVALFFCEVLYCGPVEAGKVSLVEDEDHDVEEADEVVPPAGFLEIQLIFARKKQIPPKYLHLFFL